LKEGGITRTGNWSYSEGLNISREYPPAPPPPVEGSLVNKTFVVITCLTEPYGMRKESSVPLHGNERYEGFGIDLIAELSKELGFNYTFIIREDKKNGEYDETTNEWNGMIGDVINKKADLAITDLTITSEREAAVDFTTTFMSLGISILYQKPKKAPPSFFSFADPFAVGVWKLLAAAFFGVSIALFLLGRISPSEWHNPYPCIDEPEYLVNQLSLRNCFWFMTGSLMQQGSEIAPIAISTRMVAGMWWFFTLIMVSSYTANLAAFLTTESPDRPFKDVFELADVAEKKGIQFGAKINGSTEKFFRDSKHIEAYQKIYQYMKDHEDDVMVKDNNLGVVKAETKNYAFFMETTSIEYETQRRCSLTSVGNSLDEKGYGIAMRKSKYHEVPLLLILSRLPIQTGFEYHDSQITRRGCHSKTEEKMVGRKTRRGSMS
jgi:ionotropic glutamate receptor